MIHPVTQKFLLAAALTGAAFLAFPAFSQQAPNPPSQNSRAPQQSTKQVTGTIAAIGNGGHSFTLEITDGTNGKRTMDFVMGKDTQVQGKVHTGTPVTVEYQAMATGENVAVTITAQG